MYMFHRLENLDRFLTFIHYITFSVQHLDFGIFVLHTKNKISLRSVHLNQYLLTQSWKNVSSNVFMPSTLLAAVFFDKYLAWKTKKILPSTCTIKLVYRGHLREQEISASMCSDPFIWVQLRWNMQ